MTQILRPAPRRGVWETPFWEHVEARRLHLQRCERCDHVWYPPAPACPTCLSGDWEWAAMGGGGELLSWVTFHRQYFATIPVPYTVVAVALDEGPILIADVEVDPAVLTMGARMQLTYRSVRDTDDQPFTIYGWEPATASALPDPVSTRTGAPT